MNAQEQFNVPKRILLTMASTRFEYLIHSFNSLLKNKYTINYLYGGIPSIPQYIRSRKPSQKDWQGKYESVVKMEHILGIILKNNSNREKWLLSEVNIDLVNIDVERYVEEVLPAVQKMSNVILAAEDNSDKKQHLVKYGRYKFYREKLYHRKFSNLPSANIEL